LKILVINCGSSSAKYVLFDIAREKVVDSGEVERIKNLLGYAKAVGIIKDRLLSAGKRVLGSIDEICGIGHRVVHGGEEFKSSVVITGKVIKSIEKYGELAPLHNPPSLAGIKACVKIFPGMKQVAVFDTAFHQGMPPYAFVYGIPYRLYKKYSIRRYGFHGTSHRYVSEKAAKELHRPYSKMRIITVHLGNGCSMAAVKNGVSIDTTMGFTPLEGLLMGTRSGDMDPAIVPYLVEKMKINANKINAILNKKSGFLGISGISNDMRDILKNIRSGNKRAKLAYEIFCYRIKKYIGAYTAAMGGVDAVVFTGGIGENCPGIMRDMRKCFSGILAKKAKFIIIPTNEELLIARDTYRLIDGDCHSRESGNL